MNATTAPIEATVEDAWAVYLLECVDGRVYTGIARDPQRRYAMHLSGKGARFTRSNPPRRLLGWVWVSGRGEALRLEMAWKRLPRAARIAALHGHCSAILPCRHSRESALLSGEKGAPMEQSVAAPF